MLLSLLFSQALISADPALSSGSLDVESEPDVVVVVVVELEDSLCVLWSIEPVLSWASAAALNVMAAATKSSFCMLAAPGQLLLSEGGSTSQPTPWHPIQLPCVSKLGLPCLSNEGRVSMALEPLSSFGESTVQPMPWQPS